MAVYCQDCLRAVEWDSETDNECPVCGGSNLEAIEENPRDRYDDDGIEYADPGDYLADRLWD